MAGKYVLDMVHHNPGELQFNSRYKDPAVLKAMGYNGKVYSLFESPILAADWNDVEPGLFEGDSEAWRQELAGRLKKEFQNCKKHGLNVFAMSDLFLFPKKLVKKYGQEVTFCDANDPFTIKYLKVLFELIFAQFPEMDGLVVRIGETYLFDAPYHVGKIAHKSDPVRTIIPLMKLLREEICVKYNKELFFRTWGAFDEDAEIYERVSDAVPPHENLIICVKHCEGDFHRGNPFSKIIGTGRHRQLIEIQCAREYEGKGAFPNYIAAGVIDGFPDHDFIRKKGKIASVKDFANKKPELYAGIWTWTRGGGWEGPYIKNELWCDLNASVLAGWAAASVISEADVFKQIALERFHIPESSIPEFRKLAILSADAVWLGHCSRSVKFSPWWLRDEYIGIPELPELKNNTLLKEKAESIRHWETIVGLAKKIDWHDSMVKDFAVITSEYGLRLFKILECVFNLVVAEQRKDMYAAGIWLHKYDETLEKYNTLTADKNCPTLFKTNVTKRMECEAASSLVSRLEKSVQDRNRNSIK